MTIEMAGLKNRDVEERLAAVRALRRSNERQAAEGLISALGDSEWRVRKTAVEGLLALPESPELISSLIRCLDNEENAGVRNAATEVLIQLNRRALPGLMGMINQVNSEVKKFIIDILGEIADARATPVLLVALRDENENVQVSAIEALGKVRDERSIDPMIELLKRENHLLAFAAVKALERIGNPRAVEPLIKALGKPILQRVALEALGKMGDMRALNFLLSSLQSGPKKVRDSALRALMTLLEGQPETSSISIVRRLRESYSKDLFGYFIEALSDSNQQVKRGAIRVLGWLGEVKSIPALLPLLGGEHREDVIETLVNLKRDAVGPLSLELVKQGDSIREGIAVVLGRIGDRKGTASLVRLLSDPNGHVRQAAATALGRVTDPMSIRGLVQLLDDPFENVQAAAAHALAQIKSKNLSSVLLGLLQSDKPSFRRNAASILGRIRERESIPQLSLVLKDPVPEVRKAAVEALGSFDQAEAEDLLLVALGDESHLVRIAALRVLEQRPGVDLFTHLSPLLKDENIWVRTAAVRVIGKLREDRVRELLVELMSDPVEVVRIATMELLCKFKDETLTPIFTAQLASGDSEVRKQAILALGESGNSRVCETLRPYLDDASWTIRSAAARAIGALRDLQSVSKLEQMAASDPDRLVQESALFALAQIEMDSH